MIIKSADDKSRRIDLLQQLQSSPLIDAPQRQWLRDELFRLKRGIEGERDAAHYIDSEFRQHQMIAVIHDLRISVEGEVAQIDHLLVNAALQFFLLETKCFNGNLLINGRGEFAVEYAGERVYGIPSPLEQSRRHERVLARLLERLEITGRMGLKPTFHHAVLLHPKALITRPDAREFDTDHVLKADQVGGWYGRCIDGLGVSKMLAAVINLQRSDALKELAAKLCRQHRPQDQLALPEFMKPKAAALAPAPVPTPAAVVSAPAGPARVPPVAQPEVPVVPAVSAAPVGPTDPDIEPLRRKLVCVTCRQKISFAEGKFCWNNERRFGGFQYCREHQAAFR